MGVQSQTGRSPPQAHQTPSPTTFPGPPSPLPAPHSQRPSLPPSYPEAGPPGPPGTGRAEAPWLGPEGRVGLGRGQQPALESTQAGLGGEKGAGQPPALRSCWSAGGTAALRKGGKDGRLGGLPAGRGGAQLSRVSGKASWRRRRAMRGAGVGPVQARGGGQGREAEGPECQAQPTRSPGVSTQGPLGAWRSLSPPRPWVQGDWPGQAGAPGWLLLRARYLSRLFPGCPCVSPSS